MNIVKCHSIMMPGVCVQQHVYIKQSVLIHWGFPGGSGRQNPPAEHETPVRSLGREDFLEKGMATHSSILAWEMDRGVWWVIVHGVAKNQT